MLAIASEVPAEIVKATNSVTIADSLQAPTLRRLEAEHGRDEIVSILSILILRTAAFFNIGNNISEDQTLELAYMMADRYPYETVEDFVLMFNRAKSGKYGEMYNRLDGLVIFSWMGKYLEEKAEAREKLHQRQKYSDHGVDFTKMISEYAGEGKPVLDALKQAVAYSSEEIQNEEGYRKFKQEFVKQRVRDEQQEIRDEINDNDCQKV